MRALRRFATFASFLVLIGSAPDGRAQLAEGGARALGLGRAVTALPGDAWGTFNPAAPSGIDTRRVEVFASQAFALSELRLVAASAVLPLSVGTVGAHARTYGFSEYRETRLGVTVARALPLSPSRAIDLGLRVEWFNVAIDGFGSSGTLALSLGAQVDVLPTLRAGLNARNLNRFTASQDGELTTPLSTEPALAVGLAFQASPRALVLLDAVKDLDFPLALRTGVEAQIVEAFTVRGGTQVGLSGDGRVPTRLSAGVGIHLAPLHVDIAVERHETLGMTPALSLGMDF